MSNDISAVALCRRIYGQITLTFNLNTNDISTIKFTVKRNNKLALIASRIVLRLSRIVGIMSYL